MMNSDKNNYPQYVAVPTANVEMAQYSNSMGNAYPQTAAQGTVVGVSSGYNQSYPSGGYQPQQQPNMMVQPQQQPYMMAQPQQQPYMSTQPQQQPYMTAQPVYAAPAYGAQPGYPVSNAPGVAHNVAPIGPSPVVIKRNNNNCMWVAIGAGALCCIICIVVPVVVSILVATGVIKGTTSEKDFLYFTVTTGSSCGGTKIYQYAYPTETCIPITGNSVQTSMRINHFTTNATMTYYSDSSCSTLSNKATIVYNQCNSLSGYSGTYSMSANYKSGYYSTSVTSASLTAKGYSKSSCTGKLTEMTTIAYSTCLPVSSTQSVLYTYQDSYQTCTGTGSNRKCRTVQASVTKYSYPFSSFCSGSFNQGSFYLSESCYASGDDISPYRSYDIPALFN